MKLELYLPVKPFVITQRFGENKGCIDNATSTRVIACDGHNPPKGYRSVYSMMDGHNGLDCYVKHGQPVYAAREGRVLRVETEEALGLGVVLLHGPWRDEHGHERYYKTRYWHLKGMEVREGDLVATGSLLGYADNTGFSAGDHLHFDLKECDMSGGTLNRDNGYFGAIDPKPHLTYIFAKHVADTVSLLEQLKIQIAAFAFRVRSAMGL